jgi:putative ABC transport system permease protein
MKKKDTIIQPPRWATRFLEWYCRPELLEDLQGDLNEYFERNVKTKGLRRARLIYCIDALKFFRPYTVRKPEFINILIHWIMIGSYIKTSARSIVRNKLFSTINIIGLAISMSVGLLMIAFLSDLSSFDRFHVKGERIYRVTERHRYLDQHPWEMASTSVAIAKRIKETIPGVEDAVILRRSFTGDARYENTTVPLDGLWADESFFNVFTFPLLQGDPSTALKEPYSVVLTETEARKIFGNTDALGKTINVKSDDSSIGKGEQGTNYVVTGVIEDLPRSSHLRFGLLASFSTKELAEKDNEHFWKWDDIWSTYVYVLLREDTAPETFLATLQKVGDQENALLKNVQMTFILQPLFDIALGKDLGNQIGPTMRASVAWVVGGLTFIVILSACFNYTNLSIARSMRRSREVGIRKVVGALKGHVLQQFISEAIIISLLALIISLVLFILLRPQFLSLSPELSDLITLQLSSTLIFYFIGLAVVVGIMAGLLPALFFSRIRAVQVLKDASSLKVFRNVAMRKVLIIVQYTLSLAFITATIIGYKQYTYFLSHDLGFSTENILNIKLYDNKANVVAKALEPVAEIKDVSRSSLVTSVGSYWGETVKYTDPQDSNNVFYNKIDERYLAIHGHTLLAGGNFAPRTEQAEESEVIVNEAFLKRFNVAGRDPVKAVGEIVSIKDKPVQIIGVVKDFHYGQVDNEIGPFMFRYADQDVDYLNVKVASTDWPATLARIEKAWKKIDPIHPLQATFYDDQIERAYSEYSAMLKVIGFLAFLAITIASMGLLGMVVFTTETRTKEISIRKVLGASERNLIYLLSRGFLFLLLLSALIALPATYYFFDKVALSGIVYRAPINITELLIGLAVVIITAFIMIGSQTLRVARSNPVEVLKSE